MRRAIRNRGLLLTLALLVVLGAALWLAPQQGTDVGPGGTVVLRRLLAARGIEVRPAARPGASDEILFLPHDLRGRREAARVIEWVRAGGRAVVADPASQVLRSAGIRRGADPVGGFAPDQEIEGDCLLAGAAGVRRIVTSSTDATLVASSADSFGCFRRGDGWWLVQRRLGEGTIVGLGGLTPFTNEHLDDADDVVLAWSLLGNTQGVVVGDPVAGPPPPSGGIWSLLPPTARAIVLQLALAVLVLAVARGRRLGKPVEEELPAPIPASELVDATAELYRGSRAAGHAAGLLRDGFRTRVGRRIGHVGESAALSDAVASSTGEPEELVTSLLTRPVANEEDLVGVAVGIEHLERRLEGEGGRG